MEAQKIIFKRLHASITKGLTLDHDSLVFSGIENFFGGDNLMHIATKQRMVVLFMS